MTRPTDLIREYGAAIRGSWYGLDGRGVRADLNFLAKLVEENENAALSETEVANARCRLDICPNGGGHWTEFCDESCNAKAVSDDNR